MKIKISTLMTIILYHVVFIQLYYIDKYNYFFYLGILILFVFLLLKYRKTGKEYFKQRIILFIWALIVLISSIYNKSSSGILFIIKVVEAYLFMEYMHKKGKFNEMITTFFYTTLFYIILNDLLMLGGTNLKYGYNEYYLLGNKFTVGLLHIALLIFYIQKNKVKIKKDIKKKTIAVALFIISIIASIYVDCSTTIICKMIVLILLALPKKVAEKLYNPKVAIIILLLFSAILLVFANILNNNFIRYIIVDILGEDIELTGRMNIYKQVIPYVYDGLMLGHGYGSSYSILMDAFNAPNTQNGLLENIFNYGLLGTILLITLIYLIFKNLKKNDKQLNLYPIVVYIYVFFFISSVEISIGLTLIILLSMINIKNEENILKNENCIKEDITYRNIDI